MEWSDYVSRLMGDADQVDVAERTGVPQSTLSRWKSGKQRPSIEGAVEFARSMEGGKAVEALLILGVVRPSELDQVLELSTNADDLTNEELIDAIARRLGVDLRRREVRGA